MSPSTLTHRVYGPRDGGWGRARKERVKFCGKKKQKQKHRRRRWRRRRIDSEDLIFRFGYRDGIAATVRAMTVTLYTPRGEGTWRSAGGGGALINAPGHAARAKTVAKTIFRIKTDRTPRPGHVDGRLYITRAPRLSCRSPLHHTPVEKTIIK